MASSMSTILREKEGENVRDCVCVGVGMGSMCVSCFWGSSLSWDSKTFGRGILPVTSLLCQWDSATKLR